MKNNDYKKCPYCGYRMQKGVLQSIRKIVFAEEPRFGWYRAQDKRLTRFYKDYIEAYRCFSCNKIIVEYK